MVRSQIVKYACFSNNALTRKKRLSIPLDYIVYYVFCLVAFRLLRLKYKIVQINFCVLNARSPQLIVQAR